MEQTGLAREWVWGARATLRMRGSPGNHVFVESLSIEMIRNVVTKFMAPSEVWQGTTQDLK